VRRRVRLRLGTDADWHADGHLRFATPITDLESAAGSKADEIARRKLSAPALLLRIARVKPRRIDRVGFEAIASGGLTFPDQYQKGVGATLMFPITTGPVP
jgi:hypothetical protein